MKASGVDKTVMVFGQMNEPPGVRARVAQTGLTMAEYLRDTEGLDILLFVDNIYRYVLANMEVSALLGRMPSAVGYQPTLSTDIGELEERITSTKKGAITSFQAIYVPADDYTDPGIVATMGHLDAVVALERSIVELGIYPAVDPLTSTSRILDPLIVGQEHYDGARRAESVAAIRTCRTSSYPWHRRTGEEDKVTVVVPLHTALFVSADVRCRGFHRMPGKYVPVKETVRGFKEILKESMTISSRRPFNVGTIDEAAEKGKQLDWDKTEKADDRCLR